MKFRLTGNTTLRHLALAAVLLVLGACAPSGPSGVATARPTSGPGTPQAGGTQAGPGTAYPAAATTAAPVTNPDGAYPGPGTTPAANTGGLAGTLWNDSEDANGTQDAGEEGIAGVIVALAGGECPAAPETAGMLATTDADGHFEFKQLPEGSYCLLIDPLRPENAEHLEGGAWTAPEEQPGMFNHTVLIKSGAEEEVEIGWEAK